MQDDVENQKLVISDKEELVDALRDAKKIREQHSSFLRSEEGLEHARKLEDQILKRKLYCSGLPLRTFIGFCEVSKCCNFMGAEVDKIVTNSTLTSDHSCCAHCDYACTNCRLSVVITRANVIVRSESMQR